MLALISVELNGKEEKKGAGVKLATSANMLAILFSLVTLVREQVISPCETWVVITIVQQLAYAALATIFNPYTEIGEGIRIFAFCFASIAYTAIQTQSWATK